MKMLHTYSSFWWMVIFSIIAQYLILSNVMLTFTNGIYNNLNKLYMSLLMGTMMALIMIVIMIVTMGHLTLISLSILIISILSTIILIILIRDQIGIDRNEFARSMIEHHDMAILMSKNILQKPYQNPDVYILAQNIINSQQAEINLMKSWLI